MSPFSVGLVPRQNHGSAYGSRRRSFDLSGPVRPVLALSSLWAAVVFAAPAFSAEGLYLTWHDCAAAPVAQHDYRTACEAELGEQALYAAFTMPFAVDSVVAVEIVIDAQVAGGTLPAWWQYQPDGCRFRSLIAGAAFVLEDACADFWQERATPNQLPGYFVGEPRGGPGQARLKITFALLPENYVRLEAGPMYYAARLVIKNSPTGSCSGCLQPACLVLNSIVIGRLPGAAGGDVVLTASGPDRAQRATWQGTGADCDAVPVTPKYWGALKSMFR